MFHPFGWRVVELIFVALLQLHDVHLTLWCQISSICSSTLDAAPKSESIFKSDSESADPEVKCAEEEYSCFEFGASAFLFILSSFAF